MACKSLLQLWDPKAQIFLQTIESKLFFSVPKPHYFLAVLHPTDLNLLTFSEGGSIALLHRLATDTFIRGWQMSCSSRCLITWPLFHTSQGGLTELSGASLKKDPAGGKCMFGGVYYNAMPCGQFKPKLTKKLLRLPVVCWGNWNGYIPRTGRTRQITFYL